MKSVRLAAAMTLAAGIAHADGLQTGPCDWLDRATVIAEPWEETTRTFYNGQVRLILADAIEPACCWAHLLILMPDTEDELGGRKCVAVNQGPGMGFSGIVFNQISAEYDPNRGLRIKLPYRLYDGDKSGPVQTADVIVNLAEGSVTVD